MTQLDDPKWLARVLLRFVPVDFDVFGGAAGGDQVGFAVVVEVGDREVFAGHAFVVDHLLGPVFAFFVGDEKLYTGGGTSGGGAEFAAPADGELVAAFAKEIGALHGVAFDE